MPESVTILLEEFVLAREARHVRVQEGARRRRPTQAVLAEYREKLQNWVRPILHRGGGLTTPTRR